MTKLSMVVAVVDLSYRMVASDRSTLSVLFHYDYQNIRHRLMKFGGWYTDDFWKNNEDVSGAEPIIDYEVYYASPQIGAAGTFRASEFSRLALQASVGGVHASVTDNHLLVGRYSQGSGWGVGLNSRFSIDLLPGFIKPDWLWVGLAGELLFFHTEGNTDQRWYHDTYFPTGTEMNDIPHEIESFQVHVCVCVGTSF